MDKFTFIIGIIGLVLFVIALIIIISAIANLIKRKKVKKFFSSFIFFLIILAFATSFVCLSLFLQTFSRYIHEERIGWIYAEKVSSKPPYHQQKMNITFVDEKNHGAYGFELSGNQWMVEGYFLRWRLLLRWLGVNPYYKVTRFSGRWEKAEGQIVSVYQLRPEEKLWRFLLKHVKKIPFVDAAYGIAAFQYPSPDTFYLYINDTGFILR